MNNLFIHEAFDDVLGKISPKYTFSILCIHHLFDGICKKLPFNKDILIDKIMAREVIPATYFSFIENVAIIEKLKAYNSTTASVNLRVTQAAVSTVYGMFELEQNPAVDRF